MKTISRATGICAVAILTILAVNGQPETNPPTQQAAPAKEAVQTREVLAGGVIGGMTSGKADPAAKLDAATEKSLVELKAAMKPLLETLTGIQDKASADAAVPALKKLRELFDRNMGVLAEQIRVNPAVMQRLLQLEVDGEGISEQAERIKAKDFFGSKALSEVLAEDSEERTGESTPGSGPETGKPEVAPGKVESRPASDNF